MPNTIPNRIPTSYFVDIHRLILKFIRKDKRSEITPQYRRRAKSGNGHYLTSRFTVKLQ